MYMFSENVKYIDKDGVVRDKSNKLTDITTQESPYAYVNLQNDVNIYFPKALNKENAVKLAYNNIEISLSPLSENKSSARKESNVDEEKKEKDSVIYQGVFGENTAISYTCLFEGFKEDIILYKNIGVNKFSFILKTNGLTLKEVDGAWILFDKDKQVGRLGGLYVYDALGNVTYDNKLDVLELGEDTYQLTIIIDEAFLKGAMYPVVIDPTLTIYTSGSGSNKTIQDTTIFSGTPNYIGGALDKIYAGQVSTMIGGGNRGVARTLLKFPGLYQSQVFSTISPSQIMSAELYLYESFGVPLESTVSTRFYRGAVWDESTLTYATATPDNYSSSYGSLNISSGGWCAFPLTEIVELWKTYTYYPERGLMLLNANESNANYCKYFNSTEASSNKPYLIFNYSAITPLAEGLYTIKNVSTQKYIDAFQQGSFISLFATPQDYTNASQVWYIKPTADGCYEISSVYVKHAASYGLTRYSIGIESVMNYSIGLFPSQNNDGQRWYLETSGAYYKIKSKAMTGYYLYKQDDEGYKVSLTTPGSSGLWEFTSFEPQHFYPGRYSGNTTEGDSVSIKVTYDANYFIDTQITPGMIESVGMWNGLSSKVTVYTPAQASSAPANSYPVTFKTFVEGTEYLEGVQLPDGAVGVCISHKSQNSNHWTHSNIYIRESGFDNLSDLYSTIIHELGHALKLDHPAVCYPDGHYAVLSVMNWYSCTIESTKSTLYPSVYDMMILRKKWGN